MVQEFAYRILGEGRTMADKSNTDPLVEDEPQENPREYFLAAWELTLQDVKEQVEEEREAEAGKNRRTARRGRHRLVTS